MGDAQIPLQGYLTLTRKIADFCAIVAFLCDKSKASRASYQEQVLLRYRDASEWINKAIYTAFLVACGWAGAVISLCKPQNSKIRDQK